MSSNETIRPAATGTRNGLPRGGWYTYRGTGRDIMPWAITDDCSVVDHPQDRSVHRDRELLDRGRCWRCQRVHRAVPCADL